MIPKDQISLHHDWILSQSPKQREIIANSTKLSIDNNHKRSPVFAARTLTMRALLRGKEWMSVGYVLCLTKDEDLHTQVAKLMFDKICARGQRVGCKLKKIKVISSDFEIGLWRAFQTELHKHQ